MVMQAKKKFGWEPKVPLREGLALMVDDFADRLSVNVPKNEALEDNVLSRTYSKD